MGRSDLQKLLEQKLEVKTELFSKCWPNFKGNKTTLFIVGPKNSNAGKVLLQLLEGLFILDLHVIVAAPGKAPEIAEEHKDKIAWINSEENKSSAKIDKWLIASDMAIIFEEHQEMIKNLFNKGIVPIGHKKSPLLQNYDLNKETGNSFCFNHINAWDIFRALVRALETHQFPYDWQHIMRGFLKVR